MLHFAVSSCLCVQLQPVDVPPRVAVQVTGLHGPVRAVSPGWAGHQSGSRPGEEIRHAHGRLISHTSHSWLCLRLWCETKTVSCRTQMCSQCSCTQMLLLFAFMLVKLVTWCPSFIQTSQISHRLPTKSHNGLYLQMHFIFYVTSCA